MVYGKFITLEGIDGAGKSTHLAFLSELLRAQGLSVVVTREPGGTALGEHLRSLLLSQNMHVETEALLLFAARREHVAQVIEPALARGDAVISDRFTDASFAYQGGGKHLARDKLNLLERWTHPHIQPDLTLLFDVPPEIAERRYAKQQSLDRFEQEQISFFAAVRATYLERAAQFPERFHVLDASQPIDEIQQRLEAIVMAEL